MVKVSSYKVQVIGVSAIVAIFLFSSAVFAVALPGQANDLSQPGDSNQTGLQDAKLKACQARENGIKKRSAQLMDLAKNMQDKFDAMAKRVQDYYGNTVVPSGKTVTNYNALISDIQTKKTAVQDALTKTQDDFASFSCTLSNPKETMMQFKNDMQTVKQKLKNYRTSIKNLIVAVHSVTGENNKNGQ